MATSAGWKDILLADAFLPSFVAGFFVAFCIFFGMLGARCGGNAVFSNSYMNVAWSYFSLHVWERRAAVNIQGLLTYYGVPLTLVHDGVGTIWAVCIGAASQAMLATQAFRLRHRLPLAAGAAVVPGA